MVCQMTNYVEWLVTNSGMDLYKSLDIREYTCLLTTLQNTDFKFSSMDGPRVDDAVDLRSVYVESRRNMAIGMIDNRVHGSVSVLELLVAFAIRVDMEVVGDPGNPRPDILFTEWLKNLGVLITDDKWTIEKSNLVMKKLSKWMTRDYKDDGKGGIFPLKSVTFNFSKTDIWSQMYKYYYQN